MMYQMKKNDLLSLIENLRLIRQKSGESIAFLEHLMQLHQPQETEGQNNYDPDAYLTQWINDMAAIPRSPHRETVICNFVIGGDRNA